MNLSPHFTLEELTLSATASRLGIDNRAPPEVVGRLTALAKTLESVRALLGYPMHIDSGYRCPRLNAAVGGVAGSAHVLGWAADFICPQFGTPMAIVEAIHSAGIPFDQLIYEKTWVHLSVDPQLRGEVLTANFNSSGRTSYIPGIHA